MKGNAKSIIALAMIAVLMGSAFAFADQTDITVTFQIPSAVSHSVAYAGSCGAADFAFIETGTIDGNEDGINVTQTDETTCQTASAPAVNISNTGNVAANFTMVFTASLNTGVEVKASQDYDGWEDTCTGTEPPDGVCVALSDSSKKVATSVTASTGYQEVWLWADFTNANLGEGAGIADSDTRILRIEAVQA